MPSDEQALLLQVSADTTRLSKQFDKMIKKLNGDLDKVEKKTNTSLDKFFGKTSAPKALDKVFDSTRFKILDSGAARVGLFGSALESLGPIGLGVAAALGAAAVAAHQALAAMDLGDELGDTASQLQVTTDTLQEYRYAIHTAGGDTKDADEAIRGFQEQLGRAQAGLQRNLKWFRALGFTQEQIKSFGSTEQALHEVMIAIGKLPSASERAAAASALGLQGMIPAINKGIDKFDELRAAAHRLGYVLDADTIQKLGDAKDQMEDASRIIKVQLAAAFSGTAVDIAKAMTTLSQWIAELRRVSQEAPGLFQAIAAASQVMYNPAGAVRAAIAAADAYNHRGQDRAPKGDLSVTSGDMRSYFAIPAPGTGGGAGLELPGNDTSAADAKAREARRRRVEEEIYKASVDLLNIHNNEKRAIEDRLVFTLDGLDMERQQRKVQLDELEADYARSKGKEGISHAERLVLENTEEQVRSGKEFNAKEDAALALKDEQLKIEQQAAGFARDLLDVQEQLATTQAERRRIQLQILDSERATARKALEESLSRDANLTPDQRTAQLDQFDAVTAAQRKGVEASTRGPLEDYIAKLPHSVDALNERMQSLAVEGIEGLNDAIVDLATGAGDASDILRNFIRQMLADFLRLQLQASEASLFKGGGGDLGSLLSTGAKAAGKFITTHIPGFAEGTNSAPGGWAWTGENGPELLRLPGGTQVIPNDILRGLARAGRQPAPVSAGRGDQTFVWNVQTPDADSFRRSSRQMQRDAKMRLGLTA